MPCEWLVLWIARDLYCRGLWFHLEFEITVGFVGVFGYDVPGDFVGSGRQIGEGDGQVFGVLVVEVRVFFVDLFVVGVIYFDCTECGFEFLGEPDGDGSWGFGDRGTDGGIGVVQEGVGEGWGREPRDDASDC
jgi:hypothetical protein